MNIILYPMINVLGASWYRHRSRQSGEQSNALRSASRSLASISRICPLEDSTRKSFPRCLAMVLPLLGDSTIIKFLLISYFFSQNGDKGTKKKVYAQEKHRKKHPPSYCGGCVYIRTYQILIK